MAWWMKLYGARTPKRHIGYSNSRAVFCLDIGSLPRNKSEKKSDTTETYHDRRGRKRFKGSKTLKATEWMPHFLIILIDDWHHFKISFFINMGRGPRTYSSGIIRPSLDFTWLATLAVSFVIGHVCLSWTITAFGLAQSCWIGSGACHGEIFGKMLKWSMFWITYMATIVWWHLMLGRRQWSPLIRYLVSQKRKGKRSGSCTCSCMLILLQILHDFFMLGTCFFNGKKCGFSSWGLCRNYVFFTQFLRNCGVIFGHPWKPQKKPWNTQKWP